MNKPRTLARKHSGGMVALKALSAALAGSIVIGAPVLAADSTPAQESEHSYTLVNVDAKSDNTITSFDYNAETKTLTPVYYDVQLNKTDYNYGSGANTLEYNTNVLSNTIDITVNYDESANRYDNWSDNSSLNIKDKIYVNQSEHNNDWAAGGAIINGTESSKLGSLENLGFVGNYTDSILYSQGGALMNKGEIPNISGFFIDNSAKSSITSEDNEVVPGTCGGAIYNSGAIDTIVADFISNGTNSEFSISGQGGAIYNIGTISSVKGDFVNNYFNYEPATSKHKGSYFTGAAIHNETFDGTISKILEIEGNFIGNHINGPDCNLGGAIFNGLNMEIGDISGDFIGNYLSGTGYSVGAAIYNGGKLGDITGDFVGNYIDSTNGQIGAAIFNGDKDETAGHISEIGDITGNFIGNYIKNNNYGSGAAILNAGKIKNISGNFIGNYLDSNYSNTKKGATILNSTKGGDYDSNIKIDSISGNFIGNYAKFGSFGEGAAIFNNAKIGKIEANFIGNYLEGTDTAFGGAISNSDSGLYDEKIIIDGITGDFIGNYIKNNAYSRGGAIANSGKIGNIEGNFIGNYLDSLNSTSGGVREGGAIANLGKIGNITGDFINNYTNTTAIGKGGAIMNERHCTIGDISGNFTNNYLTGTNTKLGGAIFNGSEGSIGNITGHFTGNYIQGSSGEGGAIKNESDATIKNITGNFTNNYISGSGTQQGGAIYNIGSIDNIKGNFTGNHISGATGYAEGGAISNKYTIKDVEGNFVGNYIEANTTNAILGGALCTQNSIGNITGDFINNHIKNTEGFAYTAGGALLARGTVGNIKGNFTGNYIEHLAKADESLYTGVQGGALSLESSNKINITGNFTNNYILSSGFAQGGALSIASKVEQLKGDFSGNHATSEKKFVQGGALALINGASVDIIYSSFANNYATAKEEYVLGGALDISLSSSVHELSGTFSNNYASSDKGYVLGGALGMEKSATANTINSSFLNNHATSKDSYVIGGALGMDMGAKIQELSGTFSNNYASSDKGYVLGGALGMNLSSKIQELSGTFSNNYASSDGSYAHGGALAIVNGTSIGSIKNSSFINNYAASKNGKALGGAIYSSTDLNIVADNYNSIFSGNYTDNNGIKEHNAIYLTNNAELETVERDSEQKEQNYTVNSNTLTLSAKNNSTILFDDQIDNEVSDGSSYTLNTDTNEKIYLNNEKVYNNVNLTGDMSSKFVINNNIKNAHLNISNTNVYSPTPAPFLQNPDVTIDSGIVNFAKFNNEVYSFNKLSNKATINVDAVDIDVQNETMGHITSSEYGDMSGKINVRELNYLSTPVKDETKVFFADKAFSQNVNYQGSDYVYSPIYKYDVSYLSNSGEFLFKRSSGGGNPSRNYNPAVLASPATAQAGANAGINETFRYVFEHADAFTQLPAIDRFAKIKSNKYAISTDFNNNLGSIYPEFNNKAGWFRPYVAFEKLDLKNGPKVNTTTYGSLVGFDTDFHEMKNGWTNVGTGYIGYNGSQMSYHGADTTMNGGILGFTETFYKGNFWTALTLSAGASVGETRTSYGKEDFTSLVAGVGSKTGYNFEFKEGKYIIQPIMFMSYTFVNTFDYTNAAGVRIDNDPMHSIQLHPNLRFISNTKNGWQPYAQVGMVWNILNDTNVKANGMKLPEMHTKPYVEYGVGIQKRWADKFTAFGQAMVRNGGRNGIALTFGFRWALGNEGKSINGIKEKVQAPATNKVTQMHTKTILKQMSQSQKTVLRGNNKFGTTITTNRAVLKQL